MVTIEEIKNYLGIESEEEDSSINGNIQRQLSAADSFLKSAVGEDYPSDDPRMKEVTCMIVAELYDDRNLSAKAESRLRTIARLFMNQIRLESRED